MFVQSVYFILLLQTIIQSNFRILEGKISKPSSSFLWKFRASLRELHRTNFTDVRENCATLPRKKNRKRSIERHSMKNTYWSPAFSTTLELLEYRPPMCITSPMLSCKFNIDPSHPRFIPVVIAFDVERTKFALESLQQSDSPSYPACRSKNASPPKTIILLKFIKEPSTILSNKNLT